MDVPSTQVAAEASATTASVSPTLASRIRTFILEVVSIIFWAYTIIQLFVFDIDRQIESAMLSPFVWIIRLKVLTFAAMISIALVCVGTSRTVLSCVYIAIYPFWISIVKIPYFIWKQKSWIVAFSIINNVVSLFANLRRNILLTTSYGVSIALILISHERTTLWIAAAVSLFSLAVSYTLKFLGVFTTTPVFKLYRNLVSFVKDKIESQFSLEDELKLPITTLNQEQLNKWHQKLNSAVLQNRLYLFAARKLRDYQESGMSLVGEIFGAIGIFIITVVVYTSVNLALFKTDPASFLISGHADMFHFFYYSFNNFFYSSIAEIAPVGISSQILSMAERGTALLFLAVFVSLLIAVRAQKSSHDVDSLISTLEQQSKARELAIERDYKVKNIREAIQTLESMKAGTTKFLLLISADLDES